MTKLKRDRLTLFAECLADNQAFKRVFVKALTGAVVFSAVVNVLALVGPIFMLEVYDRVLPSKSVPTLVALGLLVTAIYAFSGCIDVIRMRVMSRVASSLDVSLSSRVFTVIAGVPLKTHIAGDALKPAQELDQIRTFIAGPGFLALFDLPWVPVYLAVCFYIHAYLGWLTAFMMLILLGLTLLTDWRTRRLVQQAASALEKRNQHGQQSYRNAESLAAMGMQARALALWDRHHLDYATLQLKAGDISGMFSGISKALRHVVQSASLALGAYLVIRGDMSGGMIIAASVIVARALAPAEQVIAMWRSFLAAKNSWQRLDEVFALFAPEAAKTALPMPCRKLSVDGLYVAPPGSQQFTLRNVNFSVPAGSAVGVVGPSASGKSSLARVLVGGWQSARGEVCLDNARLDLWPAADRGRLFGYLS